MSHLIASPALNAIAWGTCTAVTYATLAPIAVVGTAVTMAAFLISLIVE